MKRAIFDQACSTEKSGPTQKVDRLFQNFSGWSELIHSVLDRDFWKFCLNGLFHRFCHLDRSLHHSTFNFRPEQSCKQKLQNRSAFSTRTSAHFRPHTCRTNIKQFTILLQGPKIWNALPLTIASSPSLTTFTGADPGFFLGGVAPLRNDVTDR